MRKNYSGNFKNVLSFAFSQILGMFKMLYLEKTNLTLSAFLYLHWREILKNLKLLENITGNLYNGNCFNSRKPVAFLFHWTSF